MEEITIRIETEINPTEDGKKVEKAVTNIFDIVSGENKPTCKGKTLEAKTEGLVALAKFRNLLSMDRIRAAARRVFLAGSKGNSIRFFLNKQVAFTGHVSFSEENAESPLGSIKVTFECKNPKMLINWLAPRKVC